VLSPSTETYDRGTKLPMFASYGTKHAWLVDPNARHLEVYRLDGGRLREVARFDAEALVNAEPFDAVTLELGALWE
jgi:Uma2 family endonuclease